MAAPLSKPIVMHEGTRPSLSSGVQSSMISSAWASRWSGFDQKLNFDPTHLDPNAVGDGYQARFVQLLE